MNEHTDKLWNDSIAVKHPTQREAMNAYKHAKLYSCFVESHDGTKLAVDLLLPKLYRGTHAQALPCVLYQARYTRGVYLRFPFRLMSNSRPYDFINISQKAELLLAGYAVVSMDFRGTGASFGQWRLPWSREERADSLAVLDWMQGQQWCNGKVVLCGQSYDATAALFTASMHHPAVRGVVALYPFWDMYNDVAIPGGIAMKSFSEAWARFCQAMDYNDYSRLPSPVRQLLIMISKGCNPVVSYAGAKKTAITFADQLRSANGLWGHISHFLRKPPSQLVGHQQHPVGTSTTAEANAEQSGGYQKNAAVARSGSQQSILDSGHCYRSWARQAADTQSDMGPVIDGSTIPTRGTSSKGVSAYSLHIGVKRYYKEAGKRMLRKAVAEHDTWDSAGAMKDIRFTDQEASERHATTADVSLCTRADELSQAKVPLQLISGWFDVTAAAAINIFLQCGQAPGSELVMGPWSHGGLTDQDARRKTSFSQARHSVDFINRCCGHSPVTVQQSANSPATQVQQPTAPAQAAQAASVSHGHVNGSADDLDAGLATVKACLPDHQHSEPVDQSLHHPVGPQDQSAMPAEVTRQDRASDRHTHMQPHGQPLGQSRQQDAVQSNSSTTRSVDNCPVHYFLMGKAPQRGWRHTPSWPPPGLQPIRLHLAAGNKPGPSPAPNSAHEASNSAKVSQNGVALMAGHGRTGPGTYAAEEPGQVRDGPGSDLALGSPVMNSVSQQLQQQLPLSEQNGGSQQGKAQQSPTEIVQVGQSNRRAAQKGELSQEEPHHWVRFRHEVHLQKPLKCLSRYDAISKIGSKIHYDNLARCGHLTFTGQTLLKDTQVLGAVGVEIWVESSTKDADLFVYLEDVDPMADTVSHVTEATFRASHRKEYEQPPEGDPRAKAALPGEPFHTFSRQDAADMPQGHPVLCRFQMMPTAYCFAKGHQMRIAVSGRDSKHFHHDHPEQQTLWIHAGPGRESAIVLKVAPL